MRIASSDAGLEDGVFRNEVLGWEELLDLVDDTLAGTADAMIDLFREGPTCSRRMLGGGVEVDAQGRDVRDTEEVSLFLRGLLP